MLSYWLGEETQKKIQKYIFKTCHKIFGLLIQMVVDIRDKVGYFCAEKSHFSSIICHCSLKIACIVLFRFSSTQVFFALYLLDNNNLLHWPMFPGESNSVFTTTCLRFWSFGHQTIFLESVSAVQSSGPRSTSLSSFLAWTTVMPEFLRKRSSQQNVQWLTFCLAVNTTC